MKEKDAQQTTFEMQEQTDAAKQTQKETAIVQSPQKPAFPYQLQGLETCFSSPRKAFIAAGGTEQQFAREVNFAMQAMLNNEYLITCARQYPEHLVEAIKNVSLTGLSLNPVLRLGYLVPYKGKVQFQPSYMGKIDILYRTGVVKRIEANLVYKNDKFTYTKGIEPTLIHEPNVFGERGELLGGYFVAVLTTGEKIFDVMPKKRIDEIKSRSEAVKKGKQSPWDTDFEEMAKKSIINWATKFLPKTGISEDMVRVLEAEQKAENVLYEDWNKKIQEPKDDGFDEDCVQEIE